MSETIYAHGVTITVIRHVDLGSLLPYLALGQKSMCHLENGKWEKDEGEEK